MHVPSWQREAASSDFKTPPSSLINGHRNGVGNFDKIQNELVDDDDSEMSTTEASSAV